MLAWFSNGFWWLLLNTYILNHVMSCFGVVTTPLISRLSRLGEVGQYYYNLGPLSCGQPPHSLQLYFQISVEMQRMWVQVQKASLSNSREEAQDYSVIEWHYDWW